MAFTYAHPTPLLHKVDQDASRWKLETSTPSVRPARASGAAARKVSTRFLPSVVVSSEDGLDELSAHAPTKVVEVNGEQISEYVLDPRAVGVIPDSDPASAEGWTGGTPEENARVTRAILDRDAAADARPAGEDLAVINAGAAIYAAGRADTITDGVEAARAALADGSASGALERYVAASRRRAPAGALG